MYALELRLIKLILLINGQFGENAQVLVTSEECVSDMKYSYSGEICFPNVYPYVRPLTVKHDSSLTGVNTIQHVRSTDSLLSM